MGEDRYSRMISHMDAIADKVNAFPRHMQDTVYSHLMWALLADENTADVSQGLKLGTRPPDFPELPADLAGGGSFRSSDMQQFYVRNNLHEINEMQFAAFVAYFASVRAQGEERRMTITTKEFLEAYEIVGRVLPRSPKSTLSNARRAGRYLMSVGPGEYEITSRGVDLVKSLLGEERE